VAVVLLSLLAATSVGGAAVGDADDYSDYYAEDEYEYYDEDCLDEDGDEYCDEPDYEDADSAAGEEGEGAPVFGDDETYVKVDLGNTARLSCSVTRLGSRTISWKRGESFLFLGDSSLVEDTRYSVDTGPDTSTLTITLVSPEDAGDFTCQVATADMMEQTFTIEIKAPPSVRISNKPSSGELLVQEGDTVELECQGEGDPQPSLTWKRLSSQLPGGATQPHSGKIVFPSISGSDGGTYQCEASNGFGHPAMDSVNLRVKHKPLVYVHEELRHSEDTEQLEVLALVCSVQAYPRAETKWRRDDAALPGARVSHNHHEGKHVVEIRRPRQSDAGVYTCEASNEMGQVFAVLDLQDSVALPHIEEEEEVMMMDSTHTSHHASAAASPGPALATLLLVLATQRLSSVTNTY